ncbi:MAG TPA: NADH-quinone oxidoreductase subunit NuoK [Acidimicrobiia bacterium]|nr:NADH-quinone oxidoreductase subunit NuoK [Acidimicrobiia bacterium]
MTISTTHYLVLAAIVFCIGLAGVSIRKNALVMFMSVELMLNAANLTFVAYSKALDDVAGQVSVFFVLVVAAGEVAVGLAIMVAIFKRKHKTSPDEISNMTESDRLKTMEVTNVS